MKIPPLPQAKLFWQFGTALLLALLVTSCETTGGIATRAQEKSATYATLKPWQKKYIDTGSIAEGFTADMVYIAMGQPDQVDPKELPGGPAELWTYRRFYPRADALHRFSHGTLGMDSGGPARQAPSQATSTGNLSPGAGRNGLPTTNNGGLQGGSMEPADLRSYTVKVLFKNGRVTRVGADQNP